MKHTHGGVVRKGVPDSIRRTKTHSDDRGSQSSDPFWTGASEGDQAVSTTSGQGPANPSTFRNVRNCRNEYEKLMNHEQNATTFRETFSLIKEAAIKAMAAIDMCLQVNDDVEPHLSRICSEANAVFSKGSTLMIIHGNLSLIKKVIRHGTKARERCCKVARQLEIIADDAWDLRESGSAYRRQRNDASGLQEQAIFWQDHVQFILKFNGAKSSGFDPAGPNSSMKFLLLPKAIFKGGRSKVRCVVYAPNEVQDLQGCGTTSGALWWSVESCLFTHDIITGVTTSMNHNLVGSPVLCMVCDKQLRIWTGHHKGEIKCWSKRSGMVLACLQAFDEAIRTLTVDASLVVWAGCATGKMMRFKTVSEGNQLQIEPIGCVSSKEQVEGGLLRSLKRAYSKGESAHYGRVRCMLARDNLVWSSGGDRRQSCTLQLWDIYGLEIAGKSLSAFGSCDAMLDVAWDEAGTSVAAERWRLVTGHETGELVLWVPTLLEPMIKIGPQGSPVRSIVLVRCLGLLLTAHQDGKVLFRKEPAPDKRTPGLFSSSERHMFAPAKQEEVNAHLPLFGAFQAHKSRLTVAVGALDVVYTASGKGTVSCWPLSILEREAILAGIEVNLPESNSGTLRRDRTLKWLNRTTPPTLSLKRFNAPLTVRSVSSSADDDDFGRAGCDGHNSSLGLTESETLSLPAPLESEVVRSWSAEANDNQGKSSNHRRDRSTVDLDPRLSDLEAPTARLFMKPREQSSPQANNNQEEPIKESARDHLASSQANSRVARSIINARDLQFEENPKASLGSGAFGVVYKGKAYMTDVAIKVLIQGSLMHEAQAQPSWDEDDGLDEGVRDSGQHQEEDKALAGLVHEASLMYQLRHPNIVMFLGVCLNPPALVTEYCAKGSLYNLLQSARVSNNKAKMLSWKRLLTMAVEAALGMHYLHRHNVEHRDLKSPNLLVDGHWNLRVADFGTSKFMLSEKQWSDSMHASNPLWLSPESLQDGIHGFKSDVYSFGIVLWELLTWQTPWENYCGDRGCHPVQVWNWVVEGSRPKIPERDKLPAGPLAVFNDYIDLVKKCWAPNPDSRPEFQFIASQLQVMLAEMTKLEPAREPRRETPRLSVRRSLEWSRGSGSPPPPLSPFLATRASAVSEGGYASHSPPQPPLSPFITSRKTVPSPDTLDVQLCASPLPAPPSPFTAVKDQKMSGRLAATPSGAFKPPGSPPADSILTSLVANTSGPISGTHSAENLMT